MKKILYLFALITIVACKSKNDRAIDNEEILTEESISENRLEEINMLVPDEEDGGEMLLGKIDRKGLESSPFNEWYAENFQGHALDTAGIQAMQPLLKDVSIKVFMGTWCEDSQREVPALLKILDATKFNYGMLEMIAVTHDKDTPQGYETDFNIEYVPTIILSKQGAELHRIVEYPQVSLENDMLTILKGEPYKHAYED